MTSPGLYGLMGASLSQETHLLGVQQPMLVIAALILSAQHLDDEVPAGTPEEQQ